MTPPMLVRIAAMVLTTYRETARDRVPLALFGAGLAVGMTSLLVAAMSLGRDHAEVVAVLTSGAISLFCLVASIVLGASSLYKDLERKTIYPILSRPMQRHELLLGKHLGLTATVATFAALDGALALSLIAVTRDESTWTKVLAVWVCGAIGWGWILFRARDRSLPLLPLSIGLLVVEAAIVGPLGSLRTMVLMTMALSLVETVLVLALSLTFGAFSTPFLAAVLTTGLVIIGRNADMLAKLPVKVFGPEVVAIGRALARVIPNLHLYVPPRSILTGTHSQAAPLGYLVEAGAYGLLYAALLLVLSSVIFARRDFA